jgi:drug/metabolite transporter (DMT)-like permease
VFASLNVFFDVLGSFLTRKFGAKLTTFDINAMRFGSAAITLLFFGGVARVLVRGDRDSPTSVGLFGKKDWWRQMSQRSWLLVSCGVLFVTVACPALSNWALFQLPLGICLCLTSIGPLFAIPMSLCLKKERVTLRAVVGSVVAIIGVVVLQLTKE